MSHPRLKLTYFDLKARAEPIRLALYTGGIDFDDDRIPFEKFKEMKPSLPFGQLPVLQINNEYVLTQSQAIARYCSRLAKLYPDDAFQAAKVDEFIGAVDDLMKEVSKSMHAEQQQKRQMRREFSNSFLPKWLDYIEKLLAHNRFDYCVGDGLTLADLYLDLVHKKERIRKHYNLIGNHKKIREWNEKHASKSFFKHTPCSGTMFGFIIA